MQRAPLVVALVACAVGAFGQRTLFNFDDAPVHTSLPVSVGADGITATLTATGQGFSIQPYGTVGLSPVGMSGLYIYPNSVYAADLVATFSVYVKSASIDYSPCQYGGDSSPRMRITAYNGAITVGTSTHTTYAGTWPTGTLRISATQPFNRIVVHYDAAPPTGGNWGPIFIADNMTLSMRQEDYVVPSTYSVRLGEELGGGLDTILYSDDVRLDVFNDVDVLGATVEIAGVAALLHPTGYTVVAETMVGRYGLSEMILAYSFTSAKWIGIAGRIAEIQDTPIMTTVSTNADQFVSNSGQVKVRFQWAPINDEDPAQDGWLHSIDQVSWLLEL